MITDRDKEISIIIDVAKAICIISVVLGHCSPLSNFFYFFHLQIFFYINSILLKTSYTFSSFLLKKVKTLYIPYVVIMLVVALIYDTKALFNLKYLLKIFLFDGSVPGLGAMWFIPCLLINTTIAFIFHKICNKVWFNSLIIGLFFILSYLVYNTKIHLYYNLHLVPYIQIIYCIGFYMSKEKLITIIEKHLYLFFTLSTVFFIILYNFTLLEIDLVNDKLIDPFLWFFLILIGIVFVFSLSIIIHKMKLISSILVYVGKSSFYVMCFHFIVFSLINVLFSLILGSFSTEFFYSFSVMYRNCYLIYALLGVGIPVLIDYVRKRIVSCMK